MGKYKYPISSDYLPKDMSQNALLQLGKTVEVIQSDALNFFSTHHKLDFSIYSENFEYMINPLKLHSYGIVSYSRFCAITKFVFKMISNDENQPVVNILPSISQSPRAMLLEDGIFCFNWRILIVRKSLFSKLFFFLNDQHQNERIIQGTSYYAFNSEGIVSRFVIDQIVPPPSAFLSVIALPMKLYPTFLHPTPTIYKQ